MIGRTYRLRKHDWRVDVMYDTCEGDAAQVRQRLRRLDCPTEYEKDAMDMMASDFEDCGFTYTSKPHRTSLVVLARASCTGEFVNTEVHEISHVGMHVTRFLDIDPQSEELCYICGDLAQAMHEDAHCYCCCKESKK